MRRRELSRILLTSAGAAALGADKAVAQSSCTTGPCYPITAAETAAGITPSNYGVMPPYPERYGAAGNGTINDQTALAHCLTANNCIFLSPGKTYLINGLTISKGLATIEGSEGAGLVIANASGNFGLHLVSTAGSGTHFTSGFTGRDFNITCQAGSSKITGVFCDNAELSLLENVVINLAGNTYAGSAIGDGSIGFFGFFQQDGVFLKCHFIGGSGAYCDGVHLTGSISANETPNNNYFLGCRAESCGGYGVRVRIGDGNIWRGGKIQANTGGGWIEGDDGMGGGPSNTVIADAGFEANYNDDLTISISARTRVHDCTFQSTTATYHIHETSYAFMGLYQRNMSFAGKPVHFLGTGTDNVWDYNNGFGTVGANETTFAIDSYQILSLTYATTINTDCSQGYHFLISATNSTSFTIANPTNPKLGQIYTWDVTNNSSGTMGTVTFGAEFTTQGAFVSPGHLSRRTITFRRISGAYIELARNTSDLP